MKILFDVMSGDNAPLANMQGARLAKDELGIDIVLVGDENIIKQTAANEQISLDGLEIAHASDVLTMEDEATSIMKEKNDCSMAVGFKMLSEQQGDAFVSAGNTGALVVGATLIAKRIKGIKRPALAPVIPSSTGNYMLIDVGANVECRPEMLVQFGIMGSIYMEKIMGIKNPRVGLANIGVEEHKGTDLQQSAYKLMLGAPFNFIGNAEARDIPLGVCDVAVCDGFTGNIILKITEGLAKFLVGSLKDVFTKNIGTKIAAAMVMGEMKNFKKKLDYKEQGGAPLMGVKYPVIKAHGSSDPKAFKNAIRQAKIFVEQNVISEIENALKDM